MKLKFYSSFFILFFLFTILPILHSCTEKDNVENISEISEAEIAKLLKIKYNLSKSIISSIDTNKLNINQKQLNLPEAELYRISDFGEYFLIIPEKTNSNNYTLLKFNDIKGIYTIDTVLNVQFGLDINGSGTIEVLNKTNGLTFNTTFINGKLVDLASSNSSNKTSATESLCQREGSETFRQCFSRESYEFTDDFISTVAYYTNPAIPVLIAGLCSC